MSQTPYQKPTPAVLTIQEKLGPKQKRTRKVRVTADSITIGSSESVDIQLATLKENFVAEIKFHNGSWHIVNILKSHQIRVNGKLLDLDRTLEHDDQVLLDQHIIQFEIERLELKKECLYDFKERPQSDDHLWEYLTTENDFDEVMINGFDSIYVDFQGTLIHSPYSFSSDEYLKDKVSQYGDASSGWLSWRLHRRLRIQAAVPPRVERPHICIRKARQHVFELHELEQRSFGTQEQIHFLHEAVLNRQSILISGATSTGKTVLLRSLVQKIPQNQRIVILEEESETDWPHPHAVALETGHGGLKENLRESLRMRPDRLIVSEIRGDEAFDFIQAINTGHSGSMTSIHANSAREALVRLENLVAASGIALNPLFIRTQLSQSINIIVQLQRDEDGLRRIETITRVTGIQKGVISLGDPIGIEASGIKQDLRLL